MTAEAAIKVVSDPRPREHILCVDDEEGILSALRQQLAVVIADQIMPGMKGVELLEEIHRRSPATTKILLTGQAGLDAVVAAINRAGLNRYIPKPWEEPDLRLAVENLLKQYRLNRENQQLLEDLASRNQELERLNHSLEQAVGRRTRELAEANARLAQLAITDGLTGLYNHRHFHERLALEVERSGRSGLPLALFMIDVDHFKKYNDENGHPAGDEVLRQLARLLADGRRVNDFVARYGGEEFAVVLVDTPKLVAYQLAEKLRARVAEHAFPAPREGGRLTVSVGIAAIPDDANDAEGLVRAADAALYQAKGAGRNQVVL